MIQFGRRMREGCRWFPGADPRYRLHPLPPGVGRGGATGSGFQPAMILAHSRACTLSVMPGNSRRSSTAAESSPPRSKALRIAAASASLTTNIARAWGTHTAAGKQRSADTTPRRRDRAGRQGKEREGRVQETAEVAKGKGRDRRGSPLSPHEPPWLTKPVTHAARPSQRHPGEWCKLLMGRGRIRTVRPRAYPAHALPLSYQPQRAVSRHCCRPPL
jgi:hypothetical protein